VVGPEDSVLAIEWKEVMTLGLGPRVVLDAQPYWMAFIDLDIRNGWLDLGIPGRWYKPLHENAGLFKMFSKIKPTVEGILEFANEYGNLMLHTRFTDWQMEIAVMGQAVAVWEAINSHDYSLLNKHLQWEKDRDGKWRVLYDSHPGNRSDDCRENRVTLEVASEASGDGRWQALTGRNVMKAAQFYLLHIVNNRLNWFTRSTVVYDKKIRRPTRVLMPTVLLGALWLQFEHFVAGDNHLVSCEVCGDWFEVSRMVCRSDKKYCSDDCRYWRRRHPNSQGRKERGK
jgi:hypothetical protein